MSHDVCPFSCVCRLRNACIQPCHSFAYIFMLTPQLPWYSVKIWNTNYLKSLSGHPGTVFVDYTSKGSLVVMWLLPVRRYLDCELCMYLYCFVMLMYFLCRKAWRQHLVPLLRLVSWQLLLATSYLLFLQCHPSPLPTSHEMCAFRGGPTSE